MKKNKCPHCGRLILENPATPGWYETVGGHFAYVPSFGTQQGWGIIPGYLSSRIYCWDTITGKCISVDESKTDVKSIYNLVKKVGECPIQTKEFLVNG